MLDLNTFYLRICEAVATDATLDTWCQSNYGRGHTVYMGWDVENLPGADVCPVVGVVPFMHRRGRESRRRAYGFSVFCALYDESSVTHAAGNLVEYTGVRNVETMRKLVQDAIAGVDMDGALMGPVESAYEPIADFPLFEVFFDMTVSSDATLGVDPLG